MKWAHLAAGSFALALLVGCASQKAVPEWQQVEQEHIRNRLVELRAGDAAIFDSIRLSAGTVARLDERTLLLAGSYREPAGAVCSALLVSRDNGRTWKESGVHMDGSDTFDLFVLDDKHAWAITCWSIEGQLPPFDTFRTEDGGNTWIRSRTPMPQADGGIWAVQHWCFMDDRRAACDVIDMAGNAEHFASNDGGDTWALIYKEHLQLKEGEEPDWGERQRTAIEAVDAAGAEAYDIVEETADGPRTLGRLPRNFGVERLRALIPVQSGSPAAPAPLEDE